MKVKIVGVGKCGSRLCYDFFAQIRNLPSSYEIRAFGVEKGYKRLLRSALEVTRLPQLSAELRSQWEQLVGGDLLRDTATYALVDSDLENNEVTRQVELLSPDGNLVFPGKSYVLDDLSGGCQYHLISEAAIQRWQGMIADLVDPKDAEVLAYAFSVGGGTGGGAGTAIALRSAEIHGESEKQIVHRMGIAILPQSDEDYSLTKVQSTGLVRSSPMDAVEKYNTGRFFVSLLGRRQVTKEGTPALDGTWLISNDLLRTIGFGEDDSGRDLGAESRTSRTLSNKGLSLINGHVGLALCTLLNASSRGTASDGDLDPRELRSHMNGGYYISGFGHVRRDKSNSEDALVSHLRELLSRTLCGTRVVEGQLHGLSIPVNAEELSQLHNAVSSRAATLDQYTTNLLSYESSKGPREFRTSRRVLVLIGQPQATESNARLEKAVKEAVAIIFPSDHAFFSFRHAGELDFLLILIIDPFVPVIINSMFDYITKTWLDDARSAVQLAPYLRDISKHPTELMKLLRQTEEVDHLPIELMGGSTLRAAKSMGAGGISADTVVSALTKTREILNWKHVASPRF